MRSSYLRVLFVASILVCGAARAQDVQRIAAVINDEVISIFDVNARISLVIASSGLPNKKDTRRRLAPQVLHELIDETLKMQEAKRLTISVGKQEIDRILSQIERQNNLPKGRLKDMLARQGVEIKTLIDQIEARIAWVKVVRRRMLSRVEIGQDEIDGVLAEIEANKGKPEHHVEEIFLPVDRPEDENRVRKVAERLLEQLQGGAKFGAVARSFSQSASAAMGGDLGWIKLGQLGGTMDAALLKMQPGQMSKPIRSLAGFHILRLRDRREAQGLTPENVKVSLNQLFVPVRPNPGQAEVARGMGTAQAFAQRARSCEDMTALGKETGSPLSGSLGTIELAKLPAQLRSVVRDLPVGQASQPIRSGDGIVVLMVCKRIGGDAVRSEAAERKKIEEMLMGQRLEILSRQYLRDLRRAAFVDVRI